MSDYHHKPMIDALRGLDPEEHPKVHALIGSLTDEQAIAQLFKNVRQHEDAIRGGLLTKKGCDLLMTVWTFWEIKMDKPLSARQQLRFARANRLPYYYSTTRMVSFDKECGIWLAMIRGNLSQMDAVLPEY